MSFRRIIAIGPPNIRMTAMQTTLEIDNDILQAAEERARATGRTPDAVMTEVLRQGLGVDTLELAPLRDGIPQIRFDPGFEATPDSILDLLDRVKKLSDLGAPLIVPDETRAWIEQTASRQGADPGRIAAGVVQESLLKQRIWPTRNGVPQFLRRSDDHTVVTMELINELRDAE